MNLLRTIKIINKYSCFFGFLSSHSSNRRQCTNNAWLFLSRHVLSWNPNDFLHHDTEWL